MTSIPSRGMSGAGRLISSSSSWPNAHEKALIIRRKSVFGPFSEISSGTEAERKKEVLTA